jgi:hypothetical protein
VRAAIKTLPVSSASLNKKPEGARMTAKEIAKSRQRGLKYLAHDITASCLTRNTKERRLREEKTTICGDGFRF